MTTSEAKNINLVDFLIRENILPQRIIGSDYWYLSPFRDEKHASFKVNANRNIWFDFGSGEGGTIIDFGTRYYNCSISELLKRLSVPFSFHQQPMRKKIEDAGQKKNIQILFEGSINNLNIIRYLNSRNISLKLASQYCSEVHYTLNNKNYYALGFKNNSGGYELRNAFFKGSCSPKDYKFIDNQQDSVSVFEGFFSFLSFLKLREGNAPQLPNQHGNFLILNSLSFLKRGRTVMELHNNITLFLDNDKAGDLATQRALSWGKRYHDERRFFVGYKDFNEKLRKETQNKNLTRYRGIGF